MARRDPGNAPQLNDRIPFVAIETKDKKGVKLLQGDRIEHPDYILWLALRCLPCTLLPLSSYWLRIIITTYCLFCN